MEQREIKFRAWDGEKMIYPPDGYIFESTVIGNDFPGGITVNKMGRKQIELMQFTGLKDKNGKEIYEGDILTLGGKNKLSYYVKFENASFVCYHTNTEYGRWGALSRSQDADFLEYPFEIIGNIHEHPHLLTAPQKEDK